MSKVNIEPEVGGPEETSEEVADGSVAEKLQETADGDSDKAREGNTDRGAEGREYGADRGGDKGKAGEGEEVKEPSIEERVNKIVEERLAAAKPKEEAPAVKQLSEEDWQKKEEEWGVGRATIKQFATMQLSLMNHITQMLDQRLGKFERGDAISNLAKEKGFSDAVSLRPAIEEFMSGMPAQLQNDPNMLKKAAIYARGLSPRKPASDERNRRIVSESRPSSPSASGSRKSGGPALTAIQKDAARAVGMSEDEYKQSLAGKRGASA